jgi:GT2 family glycosyltransferase
MKLGGFVITFNRPAILAETISMILEQTRRPDWLLVVDNGNSAATQKVVEQYSDRRVAYQSMQENIGPAGASAYALKRLASEGYDWIYWGDEDDPPLFPDTLERIFKIATTADPDVAGIGAVGAWFDWKKGESARLPDEALHGIICVDDIGGNSQFVTRREVIDTVGLPDPKLFFGSYEPEYCLRLRKAGYRLLVDGDLMRQYRENAGRMNIKPRRALVSNYSYDILWRRYYRTRNYIYMMKKTFNRPDLARRELAKALGRLVFAWTRGIKYGATFTKFQILGILHGFQGRMGRTLLPKPKIS